MMNVNEWDWVINSNDMTCRNVENSVIIKMEKHGDRLRGTLYDMPMTLFAEIAKVKNGEQLIEKIVKRAEEKYLENQS